MMNSKNMHTRNRLGFTLIELLVVISIIALLIGILLPAIGRARKNAQKLVDSSNQRQIVTGLTTYASTNRERYPLPSRDDGANYTEDIDPSGEKNRTGAVFSMLIWTQNINEDVCISPAERNASISRDSDYHYGFTGEENFTGGDVGTDLTRAIYDPTFRGTPAGRGNENAPIGSDGFEGGNFSYAHPPMAFGRLNVWSNTFDTKQAVLSSRGPLYNNGSGDGDNFLTSPTGDDIWDLPEGPEGKQSNAVLMFGSRGNWAGNIAFNDVHVISANDPDPAELVFREFDGGSNPTQPDNIFVDETNESEGIDDFERRGNVWMRQWAEGIDLDNRPLTNSDVNSSRIWWDGQEQ